jgi:hypothetical protein
VRKGYGCGGKVRSILRPDGEDSISLLGS